MLSHPASPYFALPTSIQLTLWVGYLGEQDGRTGSFSRPCWFQRRGAEPDCHSTMSHGHGSDVGIDFIFLARSWKS